MVYFHPFLYLGVELILAVQMFILVNKGWMFGGKTIFQVTFVLLMFLRNILTKSTIVQSNNWLKYHLFKIKSSYTLWWIYVRDLLRRKAHWI